MKRLLLFFLLLIGLNTVYAIDASINYATFKSPNQNYIELSFYIIGNTVHYKTVDNALTAGVETIILFKQGEEIIKFDKYILNAPAAKDDSTFFAPDFADLKRYGLENGTYTLEISLQDINEPTNVKKYTTEVAVNYDNENFALSNIQPLANYRKAEVGEKSIYIKNGYFFETQPFEFYPRHQTILPFYAEIYNSTVLDGVFYVRYFIQENKEKSTPLQMSYKRLEPQAINVLLLQLDISKLQSGNYRLVLEARNKDKELLATQSISFDRSNPYMDVDVKKYETLSYEKTFVMDLKEDQVQYCLKALLPRIEQNNVEVLNLIVKSHDYDKKRQFLFSYWAGQDPANTKATFLEYMKLAHKVDQKFKAASGYGFETDRGHVYLKYGAPNDIIREVSEPTAPPYEIWEYNQLNNQQYVKFVFSNASLVVNDFKLIHSSANGEINNPNWKRDLYKNSPVTNGNYIDGTDVGDQFNRNAGRIFDQ